MSQLSSSRLLNLLLAVNVMVPLRSIAVAFVTCLFDADSIRSLRRLGHPGSASRCKHVHQGVHLPSVRLVDFYVYGARS